ncbi:MAG TPA: DNA ligase D [Nevskia sp.]|nr:DNA ligase D [Nevskia sp.]
MPSRLAEYRRKRDFSATPEPAAGGRRRAAARGARFVVHLHHARSRHFDLRLQVGNTLRSWAVPKGPSLDPAQKRLAVQVEDHPLDYGDFEGTIPEGHYGAGQVQIWDQGRWSADGDARKALEEGHLRFSMEGSRLHGAWSLVRTRLSGKQPQWLLIKARDAAALGGDTADDTPLSEWRGDGAPRGRAAAAARARGRSPRAASSHALPARIELQLARLAEAAPAGRDWLHEVKFDGYRVLLWRDGATVRITSRGDQDWSGKLQATAEAVRQLPCSSCVLDGELVALDDDGRSSFARLQQAFGEGREQQLTVMLFDLLHLDGVDLRDQPQLQRKEALQRLLRQAAAPLRFTPHRVGGGARAASQACAGGLEGIISKRVDAPYQAGRGGAWLKVKCVQSDEYAVVGYTRGKGARARLGSLLLASPEGDGGWRYRGRVGTGLDEALIAELLRRMRPGKAVPLEQAPGRSQLRGATPLWLKPELVVEVEYRGLTADGLLRQASLKGLRQDRDVASLQPGRRDHASASATGKAAPRKAGKPAAGSRKQPVAEAGQARVRLTHPDRVLFSDPPVTKADLAAFYTDIAEFILPGLAGRPLMLLRCPGGGAGECFYQKHLSRGFPDTVREVLDPRERRRWICIDNLDGLLGLVQMNALEYHAWGAPAQDLDHADRLVIDLDPAAGVAWKELVRTALLLRERLEAAKLRSFVRTTGGKGLHVVIPLRPAAPWDAARAFSRALAEDLAREDPQRYVAVAAKARREGRIFIDYLRNARGATAVASYSLRNRPGAPIATPLAWDELPRLRAPDQFGYASIRRRLERLPRDPWDGFATLRQRLPAGNGNKPTEE